MHDRGGGGATRNTVLIIGPELYNVNLRADTFSILKKNATL